MIFVNVYRLFICCVWLSIFVNTPQQYTLHALHSMWMYDNDDGESCTIIIKSFCTVECAPFCKKKSFSSFILYCREKMSWPLPRWIDMIFFDIEFITFYTLTRTTYHFCHFSFVVFNENWTDHFVFNQCICFIALVDSQHIFFHHNLIFTAHSRSCFLRHNHVCLFIWFPFPFQRTQKETKTANKTLEAFRCT